jgi:hypothetical protein
MERHDMLAKLKALKLHGMVAAFDEVIDEGIKRSRTPFDVLGRLLAAEDAERHARSIRYQMTVAKFPEYRELSNFEFAQSPVNEQQIRTLHEGGFTEDKRNIVLVGGPGTGKSHLGLAIAIQAVKTNQRVRFFSVVDLVNRLEQEKAAGKQGRLAQRLALMDAVVLDELGYLPVSANGGGVSSTVGAAAMGARTTGAGACPSRASTLALVVAKTETGLWFCIWPIMVTRASCTSSRRSMRSASASTRPISASPSRLSV